MFYYIISTTYQKIGDLFCPVIFLDFRTVCKPYPCHAYINSRNRYFIKRSKEFYLRLIGRELFLWLEGDEGPWFESDDELLLLLFKSGLFPDKSGFSGWSQICSSDGVGDVCLLLFEFSTEGFDEIFSEILVPAKLSPEVALPETEAPETEEAEAEAGWRFSTFSWAADKRFFREMGLG